MSPSDAETLFEGLVQRFSADPSVTVPSADGKGAFGASALKVDGRIFAMLSKGSSRPEPDNPSTPVAGES